MLDSNLSFLGDCIKETLINSVCSGKSVNTDAHNTEAARKLLAHVRQRIQELQDMPHLGRPGRVPGTRELVIPHTPYLVPYQVQDHCLQILRVFHGARQWPGQFE